MSKTIFQIGLVTATSVLINFYGLILLPILTKNLSLLDYGIWVQFINIIAIIVVLSFLGLDSGLLRYLPNSDKKDIKELIFSTTILVLIVLFIIIIAILIFSSLLLDLLYKYEVIFLLILSLPVYALALLYQNYFISLNKIKLYSFFIFIFTYGDLIFILFFIRYGIIGVLLSFFINKFIVLIISLLTIVKDVGISVPHFSKTKKLLKYGTPLLIVSISAWILSSSDKILVGILINVQASGIYGPGYALSSLLLIFSSSIIRVIYPRLVQSYEKQDMELVKGLLSNAYKGMVFFLLPSFVGISILSYNLLIILSTEQIASGNIIVVPIVMAGIIFYSLSNLFTLMFNLQEKTNIIRDLYVSSAILNVLLNLILLPTIGILGAALSTMICYLVVLLYSLMKTYRYFALDFIFLIKIILASVLMGLLVFVFNPENIITIAVYILISACIYIGVNIILRNIKIQWGIDFVKPYIDRFI